MVLAKSWNELRVILQSYFLTTAKYDFNVHEKRILYYCVSEAQKCLAGEKLNKYTSVKTIVRKPSQEITMPISAILIGEDDKNHMSVKKALYSLLDKKIAYEDKEIWTAFTLISEPTINKAGDTATFKVSPLFWECVLDFSRGFHPYELQAAMRFTSVYSMRFYEMISNAQKGFKPKYSIDQIKEWFCLEDKYPDNSDFIKRVVKAAQKDLDKHAPWSFDFNPKKEGRKYTAIEFTPRECPQNGDNHLRKIVAERRTDFSWTIPDRAIRSYLKDTIGFSDTELKNNRDMWKDAYANLGAELLDFIREKYITARALQKEGILRKTPKAYVIGCVQGINAEEKLRAANRINTISEDITKSKS